MHAEGRGLKKPCVTFTATAAGVTYRIDDADGRNSDYWCDLRLTESDLLEALALVRAAAAAEIEGVPGTVLPPAVAWEVG